MVVEKLERVLTVDAHVDAVEVFDAVLEDLPDAVQLKPAVNLLYVAGFVLEDLKPLDLDDVQNRQDELLKKGEERQVASYAVHALRHPDFVDGCHARQLVAMGQVQRGTRP